MRDRDLEEQPNESEILKMSTRERERDQYWYVWMENQLCCLNITQLGKGSCSRPEFQTMFDNSDGVLDLPIKMGCISVGSKLYMIGGEREKWITPDDDDDDDDYKLAITEIDFLPNLDVYALDFDRRGCASIRVCKNGGDDDIPRMLVPKFSPLVINLDEKIYVLARRPSCKYDKPLELPVFEVFDPLLESWRALPHPPWTDPAQFKIGSDYMHHHFVWAHKIVCCTIAGFYIFDTRMEKWEFIEKRLSPIPMISCAAAEFNGFLVAMPWDLQQLSIYQLDSDGIPKSYRVLHELYSVFNPPFVRYHFQGFLTHLGDDVGGGHKMSLLYAGVDHCNTWYARVAIFRVILSCNDAGDLYPHAYLETVEVYDLEKFDGLSCWIDSAFVTYDYSNKHDVEADATFMDENLFGLDSDKKNKRAVKYMEGDVVCKKPKNIA